MRIFFLLVSPVGIVLSCPSGTYSSSSAAKWNCTRRFCFRDGTKEEAGEEEQAEGGRYVVLISGDMTMSSSSYWSIGEPEGVCWSSVSSDFDIPGVAYAVTDGNNFF